LTENLSVEAVLLTKIFGREKFNVEKLKEDIKAEMDSSGEDEFYMNILYFLVSYAVECTFN